MVGKREDSFGFYFTIYTVGIGINRVSYLTLFNWKYIYIKEYFVISYT